MKQIFVLLTVLLIAFSPVVLAKNTAPVTAKATFAVY